ncbi:MAG: hypothetical protein CMF51_05120 [Legionellales bacterium]|nr:hypothetical protein [Legionellales bacterium]
MVKKILILSTFTLFIASLNMTMAHASTTSSAVHHIDMNITLNESNSGYLTAQMIAGHWQNGQCQSVGLEFDMKRWMPAQTYEYKIQESFDIDSATLSFGLGSVQTPDGPADCVTANIDFQGHRYPISFKVIWDDAHQHVIGTLPEQTTLS